MLKLYVCRTVVKDLGPGFFMRSWVKCGNSRRPVSQAFRKFGLVEKIKNIKKRCDHLLYSSLTVFTCSATTSMCGLVLSHANCVVIVVANNANNQLCFLLVKSA